MICDLKEMLQNCRDKFSELWSDIQQNASRLGIDEPTLPRIRRVPRRLDEGSQGHLFASAEEYYQHQYLQLVDAAKAAIDNRFASETWNFLSSAQSALVTVPVETNVISNFYGADIDEVRLNLHATMLHDIMKHRKLQMNNADDIISIFRTDTSLCTAARNGQSAEITTNSSTNNVYCRTFFFISTATKNVSPVNHDSETS